MNLEKYSIKELRAMYDALQYMLDEGLGLYSASELMSAQICIEMELEARYNREESIEV